MVTKLQKWGNSQGIRIPKEILNEISLNEGDNVDISASGNTIVIRRMYQPLKKISLEELFKNSNIKQTEENWGDPVGKEEW